MNKATRKELARENKRLEQKLKRIEDQSQTKALRAKEKIITRLKHEKLLLHKSYGGIIEELKQQIRDLLEEISVDAN